jgi:hypothetical protein
VRLFGFCALLVILGLTLARAQFASLMFVGPALFLYWVFIGLEKP